METLDTRILLDMIKSSAVPAEPVETGEPFRATGDPKPHKPKAVLFDVYGTLFISASGDISLAEQQHAKSDKLEKLAAAYGLAIPADRLPELFISAVKKEHLRLREKGIPYPEVRVTEIWAEILDIDTEKNLQTVAEFALGYELAVNPVYPMPGLAETLSSLKTKGIPVGIISNAQFFTPLLFEAFLGVSPDRTGIRGSLCFYSFAFRRAKPGTYLYGRAASALGRMGIKPEEAVYVGNDMLNDMLPSAETGFMTALFAGDKRSLRRRESDARCRDLKPDWVLNSLVNIQSIV